MFDVAVIGAGVVGGMVARELTKRGASVCMLEKMRDVAMGATRANSAIVHAGFDAKEGSMKAKMNVRGSELMEQVARELGVSYRRNGSLVVGFDEEDRKNLCTLIERGNKNGVPGLRLVEREELLEMEPYVGDEVVCALYAPTGAIICPYGLCLAAVGNAMDNGAALELSFAVVAIEQRGEVYEITAADGRKVEATYVVNCAGVFSDEIARMVGDDSFRVHARRGEYILLDKDCGHLAKHTVFRCPGAMGKGILVSPTVDGNLLLGPTAEDIEDKTDTSTTPEGQAKIRAQAVQQIKDINFAKTITSFAGLRSVGSTGDFIIGMAKPRFMNVAAIESPGLSSAPAIAEYVADCLIQDGLHHEPGDFNPYRAPAHAFAHMSMKEKNALIKKDPSYAHIICRCEKISEGEIRAACRQNPRPSDVDGIKRRTRATMGRCQGGFCTPYITDILAEELGTPGDLITKFGGASLLNLEKTK